jgi:hypothetical protein
MDESGALLGRPLDLMVTHVGVRSVITCGGEGRSVVEEGVGMTVSWLLEAQRMVPWSVRGMWPEVVQWCTAVLLLVLV